MAIPFFVRFRFTTAYEYLEHRFDLSVRLLGASMFLVFITVYMGVIVLLSSRALAVATLYTMMGGIRAVVWTDVIQVTLLLGGGLFVIGYVVWSTGSGPADWIRVVDARENESFPLASLDPTIPATAVTIILGGSLWTLMANTANQMTLQRYFSTVNMKAAKRSFITATTVNVVLLVLLTTIGASLIYYFTEGTGALPQSIDLSSGKDRDSRREGNHVLQARIITLLVRLVVTLAAIYLDTLTGADDIPTMLSKTFNSLVGAMGGLFLAGMLIPRASSRAVWPAAMVGLVTALTVAYSGDLLRALGPSATEILSGWLGFEFSARLVGQGIGFTWIIPSSTLASLGTAWLLGFVFPNRDPDRIRGLTWATRHQPSPLTD